MLKKLFSFTVATGLIFGLFSSSPSIASAGEKKGTGKCSITITTDNTYNNKAQATGLCKGYIYGYYVSGQFVVDGSYTGEVVNGQKITFFLPPFVSDYENYELTVKTVVKKSQWNQHQNQHNQNRKWKNRQSQAKHQSQHNQNRKWKNHQSQHKSQIKQQVKIKLKSQIKQQSKVKLKSQIKQQSKIKHKSQIEQQIKIKQQVKVKRQGKIKQVQHQKMTVMNPKLLLT